MTPPEVNAIANWDWEQWAIQHVASVTGLDPDRIARAFSRQKILSSWSSAAATALAEHPRIDGKWLLVTPGAQALSTPVAILWALALEIDERGATLTGERVCHTCGGWGEVIVDLDQGVFIDPAFMARCRRSGYLGHIVEGEPGPNQTRMVSLTCPCDGPTRPETVLCHRLVADLAAMKSPRLSSIPALWHVHHDQREAAGDDSWQHQWWRAFMDWVLAGKEPDAEALAPLLRMLTDERMRRQPPPRRYANQREMEPRRRLTQTPSFLDELNEPR